MNNKPTNKVFRDWTKPQIQKFLIDHFGSIRDARKKLENFDLKVKDLKEDEKKLKKALTSALETTQTRATNKKESIDNELTKTREHAKTTKQSINDVLKDTKTHATSNKNLINSELDNTKAYAKTTKGSINDELKDTKEHVRKTKISINEQLKETTPLIKDIKDYHGDLLTDTKDANGVDVLSIKTEIDEYFNNQKNEFIKLREELQDKILALLPEAGAAGLSAAYFEAKRKYGAVPYEKNANKEKINRTILQNIWHIIKFIVHLIATNMKGFLFYCLFIMPLLVIVWMFNDIISDLPEDNDLDTLVYISLLFRIFLVTPFIAISWFGLNSIRLNRRLYEEYNHKQRVMQLYTSFKEEVDSDETKEQKQKLLDIMLENVGDKPSLATRSGKEKRQKLSIWGDWLNYRSETKSSSKNSKSSGK